jgi:hypothetical protein
MTTIFDRVVHAAGQVAGSIRPAPSPAAAELLAVPDSVSYKAPCPACGRDCTWVASRVPVPGCARDTVQWRFGGECGCPVLPVPGAAVTRAAASA